jgi:hypothetical protein
MATFEYICIFEYNMRVVSIQSNDLYPHIHLYFAATIRLLKVVNRNVCVRIFETAFPKIEYLHIIELIRLSRP